MHFTATMKTSVFFESTTRSFDTDFDATDIIRLQPKDMLTTPTLHNP
jgi:hypothetical protein